MNRIIFSLLALIGLQMGLQATESNPPLSCQITESIERSVFLKFVENEIEEGILAGKYTSSLRDQYRDINGIFHELNKKLCTHESLDTAEAFKFDKQGMVDAALRDIEMIIKKEKVAQSDVGFLELIGALYSRTISRL